MSKVKSSWFVVGFAAILLASCQVYAPLVPQLDPTRNNGGAMMPFVKVGEVYRFELANGTKPEVRVTAIDNTNVTGVTHPKKGAFADTVKYKGQFVSQMIPRADIRNIQVKDKRKMTRKILGITMIAVAGAVLFIVLISSGTNPGI